MKYKLREDELRILKTNRDAIYEFLREAMIEKGSDFFDLHDITKVEFNFFLDTDDAFCCIVSQKGKFKETDLSAIEENTELTAASLFSKKRYKSVFLD